MHMHHVPTRMIQPNKGKRAVELPEDFQDHLFAATFKGGPPADGCYLDMPPIGKRPLQPPSKSYGFVTAEQAMRMEVSCFMPCSGRMPEHRAQWHTAACTAAWNCKWLDRRLLSEIPGTRPVLQQLVQ